MSRERKKWVFATILFVIVAVVLTTVFWSMENLIAEDSAATAHIVIELLSGTLPDLDKDIRLTWWFAVTLTVKFYLLFLPTLGVIGLFYSLATVERRQLMRWIDLLETRDGAVKAAILRDLINKRGVTDKESLKQVSDNLDQLFKEGGEVWAKEYLPRLFDQGRLEELLGELQNRQIQRR